ncbi:DUF1996 domain-containing protein [Amycolatopsis sp. cg5]|uniref:DUF1996 domain-containing protein n=1 Tax=Amycolatopsis sp. cg5 TaxID=3238802 RepID=UPI00352516F0
MARNEGRHRIARRTKIATGVFALAIAAGALVVNVTAGSPGEAKADGADKSLFVDITTVKPNVAKQQPGRGPSKGTFTVNCGKNENGHFNPDNFIAQPGVRNGAQHLHDYVGNLSTNADSNNKSLQAAGTTCRNGDKSAYFWPVVRIDTEDEEEAKKENPKAENPDPQREQAKKADEVARVECPDVASQLPEELPAAAEQEVGRELDALDAQSAQADKDMAAAEARGANGAAEKAVLDPLKDKRDASIKKINDTIAKNGGKSDLDAADLKDCAVKDKKKGKNGIDNGDENSQGADAAAKLPPANPDNELPGNDGVIQRPQNVELTFQGSTASKVRAMPKFLRVLYGDAKVTTNGPKNARVSWTCTGFEDRLIDKYPICPEGSKVKRVHTFPSCWDGKNIDSANHRTHIVFPDANGKCGKGFSAVPQLRVSLTYNIPRAIQLAGQYKVDAFPEEKHNPASDHDDFANVMSQCIMTRVVNCINKGRTCRE